MVLIACEHFLNIIFAAKEDFRAHMNTSGNNIKDGHVTIRCYSPSLFNNIGHGEAFVQDPQFSIGCFVSLGVEEDTTILDGPVNISYHGTNISGAIGLGPKLLAVDIFQHGWSPLALVALIGGINLEQEFNDVITQKRYISNCRILH